MAAWEKVENGKWVPDNDKARESFQRTTVKDGIVTWNSNGSVPPQDCLEQWASLGLPFDMGKSQKARDKQISEHLTAYRQAAARRTPEMEAEMAFERRAAFGPGQTVVDIITGKKYRS